MLAAAACLSVLALAYYLTNFSEDFRGTGDTGVIKPLLFTGAEFRARKSGGTLYEGKDLVVSQLKGGEAILSIDTQIATSDFQFMHIDAEGIRPELKTFVFWQTMENPNGIFYAEMPLLENGGWVNLRKESVWRGTVRNLEIGVFGDLGGDVFRLRELELHKFGIGPLMGTLLSEWRSFSPWSFSSINARRGFPEGTIVSPVVAATLWLLIALLLLGVATLVRSVSVNGMRARLFLRHPGAVASASLFITWLAVHLLWLEFLTRQSLETHETFGGLSARERRAADWDSQYFLLSENAKRSLSTEDLPSAALLYIHDSDREPSPQRVLYHLLPEVLIESIGRLNEERLEYYVSRFDHLFVLDKEVGRNPSAFSDWANGTLTNTGAHESTLRLKVNNSVGALYSIERETRR